MTQNLEIEVEEALWNVKTYLLGSNVLAPQQGGVISEGSRPSKMQEALGGVLLGVGLTGLFGGQPAGAQMGIPGGGGGFPTGPGAGVWSPSASTTTGINAAQMLGGVPGGMGTGAAIGGAVGGPPGAVVGAGIGALWGAAASPFQMLGFL
jgi:hypothetical protein